MAWHEVARIDQLDDDEVLGVEAAGIPVAVYKLDGEYFATNDICTHEHAKLSDGYVEEGCIECPLHMGMFEIATGKARGAPVEVDIATYPVKLEDGAILVDLPET